MNYLRRIIELWARGKTFKRKLNVGGKIVPLIISPDAQLKYLKSGSEGFDRDLIAIAELFLKRDSNVWDVGANVGVFTFAAAVIAKEGSVVSFEADTWLVGLLRRTRNLPAFKDFNIRILPVALSGKDGVATFQVAKRGRASSSLESAGGRSQMGGIREKQDVPTLKIDTLLKSLEAPDFIKIDVEGAELMVLNGAPNVIHRVRPIFYIEVSRESQREIFELFKDANYLSYTHGFKIIDDTENVSSNVYFVPEEKVDFYKEASASCASSKIS